MSASHDKSQAAPTPAPTPNPNLPKPYLTTDGTLVIPMGSDPKYHWWKQGGQKVSKTLQELRGQA